MLKLHRKLNFPNIFQFAAIHTWGQLLLKTSWCMYMSFGLDFSTWTNFKSMITFVLDFVILRILAYWDTENFGKVLE